MKNCIGMHMFICITGSSAVDGSSLLRYSCVMSGKYIYIPHFERSIVTSNLW